MPVLYEKPNVEELQNLDSKQVNQIRREKAALLASGYSTTKRCFELTYMMVGTALICTTLWRLWPFMELSYLPLGIFASVLGMATADFFSGMLHWWFDTWGDIHTPIISPFIRSFREHHIDPVAITRHDVIETNGDNFLPIIPVLAALTFLRPTTPGAVFLWVYLLQVCIFVALTNQIHKWSHQVRPHWFVKALQNTYVILPRKNHNIHHSHPYDKNYCITTGWLNEPFEIIGYWKYAAVPSHMRPR